MKTAFGEGTIMSVLGGDGSSAFRYRVKLGFGIGFIRPSSIMHKVHEGCGSPVFARTGGHMEKVVSDPAERLQPRVGNKFRLLFATQSAYLFIRLYCLLVKMLVDIREYLHCMAPAEDPTKSYYNPKKAEKRQESEIVKYDYQGMLFALRRLISRESGLNTKEFERYCRMVSKEKVHQMVVLPKLVEKCAEALVSVAREDMLLHLYDFCCINGAVSVLDGAINALEVVARHFLFMLTLHISVAL